MNSIRTQSSLIFICLIVSILSSYLTFKFLIPRIENSNEVKLTHEVNDNPNDHSALIKSSPIRFLNTPGTNFVYAASKAPLQLYLLNPSLITKREYFLCQIRNCQPVPGLSYLLMDTSLQITMWLRMQKRFKYF